VPYNKTDGIPPYEIELPADTANLFPEKLRRGEGVTVAILDTAPSLQDLAEAYEVYHKVDPAKRQDSHPLVESLLRPNGPLTVHPASYEELLRMRAVHLRDHNYKMNSHGLFVAGLIHTIAPAAELHLYEVLNPYGVGDLESIARGLLRVAEEQYQIMINTGQVRPLIISCSLVLRIPLDGDPKNPNSYKPVQANPPVTGHRLKDMDPVLLEKILNDPQWLERAGSIIEKICDLLFWLGSRVIAAAGNDWKRNKGDDDDDDDQKGKKDNGRPEACYPASFLSVWGIGALPKGKVQTPSGKRETSTYSNLSDAPGKVGVTTFGGEAGEKQGVLGIYLGSFPSPHMRSPNETNWAWWAGTSFATPIITGVIAAVLSGPKAPATTEDAIRLMQGNLVQENGTDYQESILDVTQVRPSP
jgi:Subtilase family